MFSNRRFLWTGAIVLVASTCFAQNSSPAPMKVGSAGITSGKILSWNVATGLSPDATGGFVPAEANYVWSADGGIRAVATKTGIQITDHDRAPISLSVGKSAGDITAIALSGKGNELAVATSSGSVIVWKDFQGPPVSPPLASSEKISCLAFDTNGGLLAAGGGSLTVWETERWKPVRPTTPAESWITAIAFGGNGRFAVGDFSGRLRIFETSTSDSFTEPGAASGSVTALSYSQDGLLLAAGGTDGVVKIWDTRRVVPVASLGGDEGRVLAVSFRRATSTGSTKSIVAVATEKNSVSIWDANAQGRKALRILPVGNNAVAGIAFGANDVLYVGLQTTAPPRMATLHILALLGGSAQTGRSADAASLNAVALRDAVEKAGRGSFGRIDMQSLPIGGGVDASRVIDQLQSIARDSRPEDSLFFYYAAPADHGTSDSSAPLIFAKGETVSLTQMARWLDDVAAKTETIVFDGAGAQMQQDALRTLLAESTQRQPTDRRQRLFLAFDRKKSNVNSGDISASTATLVAGWSGKADEHPKDGRTTAAELGTFVEQNTMDNLESGLTSKSELDGDDFVVVSQGLARGLKATPPKSESTSDGGLNFKGRHDYALLIATDRYDSWPQLNNPVQDATDIKKELETRYGFTVELLPNPTKAEIEAALIRYQKQKKFQPLDQLLVLFSGHGYFDPNGKEGFLVAKDSKLPSMETLDTMIPHSRLRALIDNIPVNHILVMIDACFGGTFDRNIESGTTRGGIYDERPVKDIFLALSPLTTRKFITSGGTEYVSDGIPGHNSPFVAHLLAGLRSPEVDRRGYLMYADLVSAVKPTNPTPRMGSWGHDYDNGSDFFLISRNAKLETPKPASEHTTFTPTTPQRTVVCILGLKNISEDRSKDRFGDYIAELLPHYLQAGGELNVLSGQEVDELRRNLSLDASDGYTKPQLSRIRALYSDRPKVIVVSGVVMPGSSGKLTVSLNVQDADTGLVKSPPPLPGTEDGIDELTREASISLGAALGVARVSPVKVAEAIAGMPKSQMARELFAQAMPYLNRGDAQKALDLLQQADQTEPAPGAALLKAGLSDAFLGMGADQKAIEAAREAKDLCDKQGLPPELSDSILARLQVLQGHLTDAIGTYQGLLMSNPDKSEIGLKLAATQAKAGQARSALGLLNSLANQFGNDPRIFFEEANAYDKLGEYGKEAEVAQEAQAAAATVGAPLLEAQAYRKVCWAERHLGQRGLASAACQRASDIYEKHGDQRGMAWVQNDLGHLLADSSDYASALDHYQDAEREMESVGDRTNQAGALLNMARMQVFLDRPADAEKSLKKLLPLAKQVHVQDTLEQAYFLEANVAHDSGKLDEAQQWVARVLDLASLNEHQDSIARAYWFQADYSLKQGKLTDALEAARNCRDARQQNAQQFSELAKCQQMQGDVLFAAGQADEAKAAYQAAAQGFKSADEPGNEATVWMAQAQLSVETGAAPAGERIARSAAAEFAKEKDVDMESSALAVLLHALVVQGKRATADEVWRELEQLHPNDPDSQRDVQIAEARYRAMTGGFDQALDRAQQARDSCHQHGRVNCELDARLLGAQVRRMAGKTEGLKTELQAVASQASQCGFNLIADQAAKAIASMAVTAQR